MPLLFNASNHARYAGTLILLMLLLHPFSSKAQNDCSRTLQEARNQYDLGTIDEIPKMLGPCMQEGFTRSQRIEAYKLLILAYLFDDDQFDAEKTMTEFLKRYPEYEIMPNDPVEFIHLFETYRTTSEFSIGLQAGFNLTNPRIIQNYSQLDLNTSEPANGTGTGYHIGLGAGRYLGKRLMINMELQWARLSYSFKDMNTIIHEDGKYVENFDYKEELNKLVLPVTALFEVNNGKFLWFIRGGGSVNYILSASGTSQVMINDRPENGKKVDMRDFRNTYYFSALLGTGIHYKIPRGFLALDLRYNFGINNLVRTEARFENNYSSSIFEYLDDDFGLNTFAFSLGYYFSFYTPKKTK